MSLVETDNLFEVPESDSQIADKLMEQVGINKEDIVKITGRTSFRFTEDLHSPEMGVRQFIRGIILEKVGFDGKKNAQKKKIVNRPPVWVEIRDARNEQLSMGEPANVPESQFIIELAGEQDFYHYDWQYLIKWNLGNFGKLETKANKEGFLVLPEAGVVLFADEIEKLKSDESLTTLHASGFARFGWLNEDKEVYKLVDSNLVRVSAELSD